MLQHTFHCWNVLETHKKRPRLIVIFAVIQNCEQWWWILFLLYFTLATATDLVFVSKCGNNYCLKSCTLEHYWSATRAFFSWLSIMKFGGILCIFPKYHRQSHRTVLYSYFFSLLYEKKAVLLFGTSGIK